MDVSRELIEKFIRGECTEAERLRVWAYCRQHPEVLEQYLTEESWNNFLAQDNVPVPGADMYRRIEQHIPQQRTRKMYFRWAAAAAILVMATGITWWTLMPHTDKQAVAKNNEDPAKKTTTGFVVKYNNTGKVMTVLLPDSSVAELAVNSSLQYEPAFTAHARDMMLQGEALFKVVKDKQRPFTVRTGIVSTTALGTVFSVQQNQQHAVRVRLYTGKVVVKQENMNTVKHMQDVYLKPGEEINVDSSNYQPVVQLFRKENTINNSKSAVVARALVFNNLSLPDILDSLQKEYHVQFVYNREQLQAITFTGRLNRPKETLDDFLKTICLLNQLNMKKEKQTIYITP